MVKNKNIYIKISFCLLFIGGCSLCKNKDNINQIFEKEKLTFGIEITKSNLLDHFPKKIKNNSVFFEVNPPTCPPTYKCKVQYGSMILIVDKNDYKLELNELLNGKLSYKTTYIDSNIIINLSELRKDIFPQKKCNKWFADKLPIPFFESFNFDLGEKESKKVVGGETFFDYTYTIPSDMQIYVIQAEAGDFWKESCNENRPESLKDWKHGYSKGFAVSEKEDKLVYWIIIW